MFDSGEYFSGVDQRVLHVAAACQIVGFPHVIGTLWEAQNYAAVDVAKGFYSAAASYQVQRGADATENADIYARALHAATTCLRDRIGSESKSKKAKARADVLAWAPFIHLGC